MDHAGKSRPTAQPIAVITEPKINISAPDFHLFRSIRAALAKPKLKSSTTPMQMTAISCWSEEPMIPAEMMQGSAGIPPRIKKATNVTTPHFLATTSSSTTMPSSSSIMMLTKALVLVAQRLAILLDSSRVKFFLRQMSMISFFSSLSRFQTSQNYRSSSDLMYWISERAERQSPRPMPMLSPTMAQMQSAQMVQGSVLEDAPLMMMRSVLRQPSSPPQTSDLRYSPASMWSSSCSLPDLAEMSGFSRVI